MTSPPQRRKVTIASLRDMKTRGARVTMVTAYDFPIATFADRADVDLLLVGDSAAMTVLGHANTLTIGMPEMILFTRAVSRATRRAFIVADLPFLSYQPSNRAAIRNAGALIAAGADAVKCEGGSRVADRVEAIVGAGIPVMGHLGLTPQSLSQMSGYRVQGKSRAAVETLCSDAVALEEAGAWSIIVEAMPPESAGLIHDAVDVPVYGIGAGSHVDGQLLIVHDLLGLFVGDIVPRFAKAYAAVGAIIETALRAYVADVRGGAFPAAEHCYSMSAEQAAEIASKIPR